jgi:hypothetical protein
VADVPSGLSLTPPRKTKKLHGAEPFLRSRQLRSYSRISQHFMEPEGSVGCSQGPSTSPYPKPDQSSPYHPILSLLRDVKWVPCHHGLARPQVADGGDGLQIWRISANILNKQSRTADKVWSSRLGFGRGANKSSP